MRKNAGAVPHASADPGMARFPVLWRTASGPGVFGVFEGTLLKQKHIEPAQGVLDNHVPFKRTPILRHNYLFVRAIDQNLGR